MDVVNPAIGDRIEEYEEHTRWDMDSALDLATEAFDEWRECPLREREEIAGDRRRCTAGEPA